MDPARFFAMTRTLGSFPSRRDLMRGLASGLAIVTWTLGVADTDAKKKHGKKKKKRRRPTAPPVTTSPPPPGTTSPPPPGTVLSYQCARPKTGSVGGDGTDRFAQTFVAERGGPLRQIQFSVEKQPATSGDYVVQLLKVVGGKPSHSAIDVLVSVTVPDATVATSSESTVTATFTGPTLVAGTEYAAAFSRPGTGPGGAVPNIVIGDGSACSGKWYIANGAGAFNEAPAQDMLVSVLVV